MAARPIKRGFSRQEPRFVDQPWAAYEHAFQVAKFLSENCINCYRALDPVPNLAWDDRAFDFVVSRLLIKKIRARFKNRKTKCGNVVLSDDRRRELMRRLLVSAFEGFPETRELANLIRAHGPSILWKQLAVYRHNRKCFGIKGVVCRIVLNDDDRSFFSMIQCKSRIACAERSLDVIKKFILPTTVWEGEYVSAHFSQLPILYRLNVYKLHKKDNEKLQAVCREFEIQ